MYRNIEVRKYCEESLIYFDTMLFPNRELATTLNSFRNLYPGLHRWSNKILLDRLKKGWLIVDTIQENHVQKIFENNTEINAEMDAKEIKAILTEIADGNLLDMKK